MDRTSLHPELLDKYDRLISFLTELGNVLIAFSGGVDSTFLLKVAHDVLGDRVLAVIATSETYPPAEIQEAQRLAESMGVRYRTIQSCEMENPEFVNNPPERCYHCKMELFSKIREIAEAEGIPHVLDGANFEDTQDFRPGSKAAEELGVVSPLRELGFVKQDIRDLSHHLDLPTWNKPSMACLSSRFPYYTKIEPVALRQIARAEDYLRSLGFSQLRVRHHGSIARIEIPADEIPRFLRSELRDSVVRELKSFGYAYVTLDLLGYRTGSLNETLSEGDKAKS